MVKRKNKNPEHLSKGTLKYLESERKKGINERYKLATGCRLTHCVKCGKEIYSYGSKYPLCKECIKEKEHKYLLKKQEELARQLGLIE